MPNRYSFIAVLLLHSFAGRAAAAQITVFETSLDHWRRDVSAKFAANRDLGRAWIDVYVATVTPGDEAPTPEVISRALEGLYYDPALKQVLYRTANQSVVCAEDASFLWSTYLKDTGWCLLTSRFEKRKMDNGFNIGEQTVSKVVFEVRGAQGAEGASDRTALAGQLKGAEISLQQGLAASSTEGKPISAKFEVENGKLQLSVYIAKGASFSEVIIDHQTGKIAKAEPITGGDDLAAAIVQGEAMTKARTSLQGALAKAAAVNQAYRPVSVTSALKDGRPIALITLMKGEDAKAISERLD
jgi:hypothetical protein